MGASETQKEPTLDNISRLFFLHPLAEMWTND
jgi:hypothetical protein